MRAKRSGASLARQLPIGVMGQNNSCISRKWSILGLWSHVHRGKNVYFSPPNHFRKEPAQPGPALTISKRSYLCNYQRYSEKKLLEIKVWSYSLNLGIKSSDWSIQSFMIYRRLNDNTILMVFPRYLLIQATFLKSENGIWKLLKNAIEPLNLVLKIFKFQPQKMQKTWFLGVFHMFFAIFQHEKIITCNFDWPHQKVRQKCFKNHYWFSHYSLSFTKITVIICYKFKV